MNEFLLSERHDNWTKITRRYPAERLRELDINMLLSNCPLFLRFLNPPRNKPAIERIPNTFLCTLLPQEVTSQDSLQYIP